MEEKFRYAKAEIVTRQDVRVSRAGWVTRKDHDELIGMVSEGVNAAGVPVWRASAGDMSGWAESRNGAVAKAIELHNMEAKARAYDRLAKMCGIA